MLAAQLLNKSVVSSAAANGALGADAVGYKFKHGFCVVVKSANYGRVDCVFNACGVKVLFYLRKVLLALLANIIGNFGRALGNFVILGAFAVQQTHRVFLQTRKAGRAKLLFILRKIFP